MEQTSLSTAYQAGAPPEFLSKGSTPSGAIPRIVRPGEPLGLAPRGRVAREVPLVFPNKNPADILDYTVDFSLQLAGECGVAITGTPMVNVTPTKPGAVCPFNVKANRLAVNFSLAGGLPNKEYFIFVIATLSNGGVVQAFVRLCISSVRTIGTLLDSPLPIF
jgi:hypothetical protein